MMFPTIAPLVLAHRSVVARRGEGPLPSVALVAGYLAIWTLTGLVPLAAILALGTLGSLAPDGWVSKLGGVILVAAGLYQFSSWKGICLRACRHPIGFVLSHDFGSGAQGAFRAGASHGLYCLGCCWALMTVLVLVGLMNLGWMALLTIVFLAEKNWRYGVELSRVAGTLVALLGVAVMIDPSMLSLLSGGILSPTM
jgi:predicted metal-binding membrane protein